METNWAKAIGVLVTVSLTLGTGFILNGLNQKPHDHGQIVYGSWFLAGALMLVLIPSVIWPTIGRMLGPVRARINGLGGGSATRSSFEVTYADYGLRNTPGYGPVNVTDSVKSKVSGGRLVIDSVDGDAFGIGDPAPGRAKTLEVHYRSGRKQLKESKYDGERVTLPLPPE